MPCAAGADCIHDHVWPHLRDPKPGSDGRGYRSVAPCHPDTGRSLSISTGATGRVIWHCFAGCEPARVRDALIRHGVRASCLPRPSSDAAGADRAFEAIVFSDLSHPHKVLRLAALMRGYGSDLPRGADLADLAGDCGVSLREAYRAAGGQAQRTST